MAVLAGDGDSKNYGTENGGPVVMNIIERASGVSTLRKW